MAFSRSLAFLMLMMRRTSPRGVQTITIGTDEGDQRIDRWLKKRFPQLTQGAVEKMCRTGQLRVDGGRVKANTRIETGQEVRSQVWRGQTHQRVQEVQRRDGSRFWVRMSGRAIDAADPTTRKVARLMLPALLFENRLKIRFDGSHFGSDPFRLSLSPARLLTTSPVLPNNRFK